MLYLCKGEQEIWAESTLVFAKGFDSVNTAAITSWTVSYTFHDLVYRIKISE